MKRQTTRERKDKNLGAPRPIGPLDSISTKLNFTCLGASAYNPSMSQTADERVVREIDLSTIGGDLSPIIGYLASSSAPFASSLLYSSGEKRKYEDRK